MYVSEVEKEEGECRKWCQVIIPKYDIGGARFCRERGAYWLESQGSEGADAEGCVIRLPQITRKRNDRKYGGGHEDWRVRKKGEKRRMGAIALVKEHVACFLGSLLIPSRSGFRSS